LSLLTLKIICLGVVIFLPSRKVHAIAGDTLSIEIGLTHREDVVFFGGFEETFGDSIWKRKWGIPWEDRVSACEIIKGAFYGGYSLKVNYPKGGVGPGKSGAQFPMVFSKMPGAGEGHFHELYLRYYLKFEEGFDFNQGGKLPGFIGGGDSWSRSGGNQPDGTNGWSMRLMWRANGRLVVYAYVPKSGNRRWGSLQWGQDIDLNYSAIPGKWICVEQYINVVTPNQDNGLLKVWIDGIECLNISDLRYRTVNHNNGEVGGIYFSTFHGGNTPDWAPRNDSSILFDAFAVAKKRVGLISESDSTIGDKPAILPRIHK